MSTIKRGLSFDDFKKDPALYVFFLCLLAVIYLYVDSKNISKNIHNEDKMEIREWKAKDAQKDSIINKLYYLNGIKAVLDSAKFKANE